MTDTPYGGGGAGSGGGSSSGGSGGGYGSTSGTDIGTTGSGASSFGGGSSGIPSGDTGVGSNATSGGTETHGTQHEYCPTCGQSTTKGGGLEQFLGRIGITDEMIGNLKNQFGNVDVDEYLSTARNYLKNTGNKATSYAKENPGTVAAGVAALAVGAGLLYAALNREKGDLDATVTGGTAGSTTTGSGYGTTTGYDPNPTGYDRNRP
ncbi:MAG TPA: hypothetical protein VF618_18770 [Thermoanaerobaculia bacterium]